MYITTLDSTQISGKYGISENHLNICSYVHTHTHVCVCVCVFIQDFVLCILRSVACMSSLKTFQISVCMYTHAFISGEMCVCLYCMYVCVCVCVCIYIYIYIYIYIGFLTCYQHAWVFACLKCM
jgi:hypothetical protein